MWDCRVTIGTFAKRPPGQDPVLRSPLRYSWGWMRTPTLLHNYAHVFFSIVLLCASCISLVSFCVVSFFYFPFYSFFLLLSGEITFFFQIFLRFFSWISNIFHIKSIKCFCVADECKEKIYISRRDLRPSRAVFRDCCLYIVVLDSTRSPPPPLAGDEPVI